MSKTRRKDHAARVTRSGYAVQAAPSLQEAARASGRARTVTAESEYSEAPSEAGSTAGRTDSPRLSFRALPPPF